MITSATEVVALFMDKLEMDDDFFAYYGVTEEEAMTLAQERAMSYLRQAISIFKRRVTLSFTLALGADGSFEEELTDDEGDILSEIMVLVYYQRGLAKLKPKINLFSASELRILHSPANERTSYVEMLADYEEHIRQMLSWYASRDRTTGAEKLMDMTIPEEIETE